MAWLERAGGGRLDIVHYDTAQRTASRVPLPLARSAYGFLEELDGDHLYWTRYSGRGNGQPQLMRTTLSAGTHGEATGQMLAEERQGRIRFVVGRGTEAETVSTRDQQSFELRGPRLEPVRFDGEVRNANYFVPVFDPVTGRRLSFRAPPRLANGTELIVFHWYDEDRFVLANRPSWQEAQRRDVVECRISTEQYEIIIRKGRGHWLALPGAGMPG